MRPPFLPAGLATLAFALASAAALAGGPAPAAPPAPGRPVPAKPPEPAPSGVGIVFEKTTFAEALAKAKAASRPLFVDFFSEGWGPCLELERTTFQQAPVGALVTQKFVAVRVSDGPEAEALGKAYQIDAFPTLLVVDGTGAELDRHLGYLDGPALVKELERILRGERTLPALAAAAQKAPDDVEAQRAYALRLLASDAKAAESVLITLLPKLEGKRELLVEAWLSLAKAASILGDEDRCLAIHRRAAIEFVGTAAANQALLELVQKFAYERRDVLAAIATVLEARKAATAAGQPLLPPPVELQLVTILVEAAAEAFEKAIESEAATGAETKELALAGALARLDPVRAAEMGKKAVAKHPDDLPLLVTVARLLLEIGDVDEALPLAEKALQKSEDDDEKAHLEELVAKIKAVQAVRKAREAQEAAK